MDYTIITTALLPVAILIFYIYHKDSASPEPASQLLKGFLYGVISLFVSFLISIPFGELGLYPSENTTITDSIRTSFYGAAIPEESAKLLMLWLLLRKNKYFDEKMDGIVYAVCISLGFAALENIMYLYDNYEEWLSIGISRAIFAIPGHFGFGILMGYYYSLAKFDTRNTIKNKILILAAPIIAHGCYDSILFIQEVTPQLSTILTLLFWYFCHKLWKYGSQRIQNHLKNDNII